jgi:predicted transposase YdaD
MEKGIEKGIEKGELKKATEGVTRMLEKGYAIEDIMYVMNVSRAFVLDIVKKMEKKKKK